MKRFHEREYQRQQFYMKMNPSQRPEAGDTSPLSIATAPLVVGSPLLVSTDLLLRAQVTGSIECIVTKVIRMPNYVHMITYI